METKRWRISPFLFFLLLNLAVFFASHAYFTTEALAVEWIEFYLSKIVNMIFPTLAAVFTLSRARVKGNLALFVAPLVLSITKAGYYFPYFYELYVLEEHVPSGEALLSSAVLTLAVILLSYVHVLIYALIAKLFVRLFARRVEGEPGAVSPYDFSHPSALIPLVAVTSGFIYTFVFELLDTVSFLRINISTLGSNELMTMVINYVLIISVHVCLYLIAVRKSASDYYELKLLGLLRKKKF